MPLRRTGLCVVVDSIVAPLDTHAQELFQYYIYEKYYLLLTIIYYL